MMAAAREKTKDFQGRKPRFEGHCTMKYCIKGEDLKYEQRFKLGEEIELRSEGVLVCEAGVAVRISSCKLDNFAVEGSHPNVTVWVWGNHRARDLEPHVKKSYSIEWEEGEKGWMENRELGWYLIPLEMT